MKTNNCFKYFYKKTICRLFILTAILLSTHAKSQTIPGTGNGTIGILHLSAGWTNESLNGGTPDLSDIHSCIISTCPWNTSPTDFTNITLPVPPNGDTIFADVYTGCVLTGYVEMIGTTITNLTAGNTYTINIYLLAGVSGAATGLPIFFPTSVDVVIQGVTITVPLGANAQNAWKLFPLTFVANANSADLKIGNPLPQAATSCLGGGIVCISIGDNTTNCANAVHLGNDISLCQGDSITLHATTSPNATYQWQDQSTDSVFTVTSAGTYSVLVSETNCSSTDTIQVSYKPLPLINLGNDTALCEHESLILNATTANASYMWQDNSTDPVYNVSAPGDYHVTLTVNGCSNADTISVHYKPLPTVNLGNDTAVCEHASLVLNASASNASYVWQDNSTNPVYTVTGQGDYFVTLTVNGCSNTDTISVHYKSLPEVNLGDDVSLCNNKTLELNAAAPNATYLWQDNTTHSNYTVTKPGIYWVKLTVDNCSNSDNIKITYINCDCVPIIPNAITPNGDGINDRWILSQNNCINKFEVSVYNRYGSLVYHSDNYQNDWQGTYKSKTCPDGTYYYIIKATNTGGNGKLYKGNITILR